MIHSPCSLDNAILAGLPTDELQSLAPYLERVSFSAGDVLYQEGEPIHFVYFPRTALISLLISMSDGTIVEVATVGSEGMLGIRALLGAERADSTATLQLSGECLRVKTGVLAEEFACRGKLRNRLLHYTRYMLAQVEQSAACNRIHLLEQRFCRWLLMVYHHVHGQEFTVTHEVIAQRLGTPRSEVSIVANRLRSSGYIRYRRGRMRITDPAGLESLSCECYPIIQRELRQLLADLAPQPAVLRFPARSSSANGTAGTRTTALQPLGARAT